MCMDIFIGSDLSMCERGDLEQYFDSQYASECEMMCQSEMVICLFWVLKLDEYK